eukprot:jgi/Ulvmu1/12659/UM094_0015.1
MSSPHSCLLWKSAILAILLVADLHKACGRSAPLHVAVLGPSLARRSLLAQLDCSIRLNVTSAALDTFPSLDLLFTVSDADDPRRTPFSSAILSLSDVPAASDLSSDTFPVYSIEATFTPPSNATTLWEVIDARTCPADADTNTILIDPCPLGAVLWNATTQPGDTIDINSTLLYRNITAQIVSATINGSRESEGTEGIYGVLTVTDIAGEALATSFQELGPTGLFQAEYWSHLLTTFSVNLPWSNFEALAEVNISSDIPTPGSAPQTVNVSVPITPLCSTAETQLVSVPDSTSAPVDIVRNAGRFYTAGTNCSWLLSTRSGGTRRFTLNVRMAGVGPGGRLTIVDAAKVGTADEASARRVYEGYSAATANDQEVQAEAVLLWFEASTGALAARGPLVAVQVAGVESGMSTDTVRRIIFGGTFALIGVYIVSAIIAWRRFRVQDTRRRDNEREAARNAVRALAMRRAREAIQLAQERLRAASNALPEHLVPLLKIIQYGHATAGGRDGPGGGSVGPGSAGLASAETAGGTGRSAGSGPLAGLSIALSEFTGRSAASARSGAPPESSEGPLSLLLQDEPCAICLGDYEEDEDAAVLPCGHMFHAPCVHEWFQRSRECPLCKDDVAVALQQQKAG